MFVLDDQTTRQAGIQFMILNLSPILAELHLCLHADVLLWQEKCLIVNPTFKNEPQLTKYSWLLMNFTIVEDLKVT